MSNSIVVFNGSIEHKVSTNKAGMAIVTYLSKKEYGEKFSLKGASLRRAHDQYRIDRGVAANGNLATLMTSGQIVAEKMRGTGGGGFSVKFTPARNFGAAPVSDPVAVAGKLSDEQLLAILNSRKAQAPAIAAPVTAPAPSK